MGANVPEFGNRVVGAQYRPRPGAYAVIFDKAERVALVRTPGGLFLPGGGIDPNESVGDALVREVIEECGWRVTVGQFLGKAMEYVFAECEGYFAKECVFFIAEMSEHVGRQIEMDHQLEWTPVQIATGTLTHKSQSWALGLAAAAKSL